MSPPEKPLKRLKAVLWREVIGTTKVISRKIYYEQIVEVIRQRTGENLHWHTIRNLYEDRNKPSPQTLNIIATFLLGSEDDPKTFQHFVESQQTGLVPSLANRVNYWIAVLLILLLGTTAWYFYQESTDTRVFHTYFQNRNLPESWTVWNVDSQQLNHFPDSGGLVLGTFLGDTYLTNIDYEPRVNNIVTRPIRCGSCCDISVTIRDFNPYQPYQQAGFFLFYGREKDEIPSLRYGFGAIGDKNLVDAFLRDGKYSNESLTNRLNNLHVRKISRVSDKQPLRMIDSIELILHLEENQYSFSYRVNGAKTPVPILSQIIDLPPPTYIGLAAFQGRPDIPFPIQPVADTLPVTFSRVVLSGCEEK